MFLETENPQHRTLSIAEKNWDVKNRGFKESVRSSHLVFDLKSTPCITDLLVRMELPQPCQLIRSIRLITWHGKTMEIDGLTLCTKLTGNNHTSLIAITVRLLLCCTSPMCMPPILLLSRIFHVVTLQLGQLKHSDSYLRVPQKMFMGLLFVHWTTIWVKIELSGLVQGACKYTRFHAWIHYCTSHRWYKMDPSK